MIPTSWSRAKVSDVCKLQNGHGFRPPDWSTSGYPIIRIQNLNGNANFNYFAGVPDDRWLVQPGQMLFAWAGTKGASFGPTIWNGPTGVLNQHIFKVFPADGVDRDWLYLALRHVTDRIESKAHGFKATLVHVKKSEIDDYEILMPPQSEQRQIVGIVATWDRAIETVEALIANARAQKKALMQSLLTAKHRLPGFSGDWRWVKFSEVFERVRQKNDVGNTNVLTISAQHGLISQVEYFNKSVASEDVRGYTLLHRGDFAYNKSYSDGYPMGAFKPLERYDNGIVSSLYICFRLAGQDHDHGFFRNYFEAGLFNREISAIAQEGARNHGLLNVSVVDFFDTSLHAPSHDEQVAIATVINGAEQAEQALRDQLTALRQEKSALMQQLLTGKRRVKLTEREAA